MQFMSFDPLDPHVTQALNAWRVQEEAGVALEKTLEVAARSCPSPKAKDCFIEAGKRAAAGARPVKLVKALEPILPPSERAVLTAGFRSGRLDRMLGYLFDKREMWHRARSRIRAKMLLPAGILLAAAVIGPLPYLVLGGSVWVYGFAVGFPLTLAFVLWRVTSELIRARQFAGGAGENPAPESGFDRVLLVLPFVSRLERLANLSEFTAVLGHLIGAGVLMSEALTVCARVLTNGRFRAAAMRLTDAVHSRRPLAEALAADPVWPPEITSALSTAEQTGTLEEGCFRLTKSLREDYQMAVDQLADWLPRILYVLVALLVIFYIAVLVLGIFGTYASALMGR